MTSKLTKIISALLCMLFCLYHTAVAEESTPINRIAAVVNDQVITEVTLNEFITSYKNQLAAQGKTEAETALRKQALDQLIGRDLQLQMAKMMSITISDNDINAALQHVADEHHLTVAQLPEALQQQGLTMVQFKKQLKDQLTLEKFQQQQLAGAINIKPKEIDAMARQLAHAPKPAAPAQQVFYHFVEIFIPLSAKPSESELAKAKAAFDEIAKAVTQNEDFNKISLRIVGRPVNDLGWRSTDQLPKGFADIAQKMKPGQVAPPARSKTGLHIIKLVETKTAQPANNELASQNTAITETHVRHILLKKDALTPKATAERRLLSLRDDIVHGGDFTQCAKENSEDPGSVAQGGDLGWVKPETLDPKFESAMNALKVNEVSMPVESQFGWHLIQVLERRQTQDSQTVLKIKAQQILFQQKMEVAVKQMISQLKAQAYIKIY